ncbi:putative oligopeptide transporter, OPT family [Bryocella elongata]|uniref:Putative oligopeptide transporter, OPT family n=1 Tax=Bryocella elongata TaxID=863522 RepID=A0A1H5S391_9BACT|nr:oligopeptide transporter, OPT family [Bryocella elongata]SEF45065.1 putative oligopeptide transporter, OPT family [Bryocella elongata]
MAAPSTYRPFVSADESPKELTVRALVLGAIFGIIFGAVTVYVGLKAGLTVAASIPISVLSISILRVFGRASILENNIVQTAGNAGQSIASGVIFTLPALVFLGFDLEGFRIFALALFGGWLGVLFMIPLRRQLIVEEHATLTYPEGTACAEVLKAGERGGSFASRVFLGLGFGALYALFQNEGLTALFPATPNKNFNFDPNGQQIMKGAAIRADVTPEYLGVGYIIGIRVAAIMLAGGVFSWLVLMPTIVFFGKHLPGPLYPGTVPISMMDPSSLWRTYVRPMGAGAVAASGLITLLRTAPTIISALTSGFSKMGAKVDDKLAPTRSRIEHDLPMSVVAGGSLLLVLLMFVFLQFKPVPGAQVGVLANFAASLLIMVFGFLFVTVSARIVGIVGSSASPVSGMTIATLMATAAIFLVKGWTAPAFGALAITIGGVVCIAASNAGDTSQDLKTGFLIGATPWKQQVAVMFGVVISTLVIGLTLNLVNKGFESFSKLPQPKTFSLAALPEGVQNQGNFTRDEVKLRATASSSAPVTGTLANPHSYILLNAIGSPTLEDGKYLYNPATQQIEVQWTQGIGSEKAAAPQGRLMATVINGILSRKLPWGLVLLGVALVIGIELLGVRSLTFAVGAYLSIGTTLAIFCGGLVRWLSDQAIARAGNAPQTEAESEVSPGSLFASGLIASGGIMGLVGVAFQAFDKTFPQFPQNGPLHKDRVSVVCFALLGFALYHFARKPMPAEAVLEEVEQQDSRQP